MGRLSVGLRHTALTGIIPHMGAPKGFLITWTCYGTWLWGDGRWSVDDEHNAYATPLLLEDAKRVAGLQR